MFSFDLTKLGSDKAIWSDRSAKMHFWTQTPATTEMVPDSILAPEFFGHQEIWSLRNLGPKKFGPREVWSFHEIAI